ncbi:uncharacterized protein LOC128672921 [Plodia interpunctella]|uniref:uncharacterized protein LOC128672921 n=1 Tax=Plodia interpunctella TaxID=58824 RepID=UPI0023688E1A|nr:uncharacterized protein LOC128672921 [Plodia interpunctella]XP_053606429.1 uncharacterized protein LOC128672921 [Plodia interpunctella]XP_053606430.1 uncharacterized protein LOC128672921 [Plodia interpunctella]XP_053606431.1 uncharacterized protein LOC128672921 [Plodia interpunctella]XP_053606432.1 uncharacterized protein LOC128672921 [Plodia interpunctella]
MPGNGATKIKREPLSDEDDSNPFAHTYLANQLPSLGQHVKPERGSSHDDSVPQILHHLQSQGLEELAPLAPAGPAATPVCVKQEPTDDPPATSLETLEPAPHATGATLLDRHMSMLCSEAPESSDFMPLMTVKDEPMSEGEQHQYSGEDTSDSCGPPEPLSRGSPKSWTQRDMDNALEALRKHNMSLTKASATYGIPSTTLWQRAHRLGIDTPKREGAAKCWSDADLRGALRALRAGAISANKASKAYGIPSSTLYKIARREGIRLAAPFNAAPTAWRRADLERALDAVRRGASSVQRAAAQFGIPTGTLYGRCKREGIELSRSNPTPWSEDAMGEALAAVRVGQMSINQAAIHYNLPYSSLYGRFKRCKYQTQNLQPMMQQADFQKQETEQVCQPHEVYYQHQGQYMQPNEMIDMQNIQSIQMFDYQSYYQNGVS